MAPDPTQSMSAAVERMRAQLADRDPALIARAVRTANRLLVLRLCEERGLEPHGALLTLAEEVELGRALDRRFVQARARYGRLFAAAAVADTGIDAPLRELMRGLYAGACADEFGTVAVDALGQVYEQQLAAPPRQAARKAEGVYYTPRAIAEQLVADTVGRVGADKNLDELDAMRVVDPACGSGMFLLRAYAALLELHLAAWRRQPAAARREHLYRDRDGKLTLRPATRRRILERSIFGVDRDPHAVEIARLSLALESLAATGKGDVDQLELFARQGLPELDGNLKCRNSLLAPDFAADPDDAAALLSWSDEFAGHGFDVVIGNPPWGQKQIVASAAEKRYLRARFPSAQGIFDWFRPFVELGLELTSAGGSFGMVLPDIVLLKNYEPTRRLLLAELALTRIEWLGMAFAEATIDAVTISGIKRSAEPEHMVEVLVRGSSGDLEPTPIDYRARVRDHKLLQADFGRNPRAVFNLLLTPEKRRIVAAVAEFPRLGDYFAAHEGIHSGNIRAELFVEEAVDDSCQRLYFGRGELRRYQLDWAGRYVRLAALPERRSRERYANLGRREWHDGAKVLVRRTGDSVNAAVDDAGLYASNNFFLVFASKPGPLGLDGLCALLNSSFMTWYFRAVEPRQGRAFAELKIKHLVDFPLPLAASAELDRLGEQRRVAAADQRARIDAAIDAAVLAAFAIGEDEARAGGLL